MLSHRPGCVPNRFAYDDLPVDAQDELGDAIIESQRWRQKISEYRLQGRKKQAAEAQRRFEDAERGVGELLTRFGVEENPYDAQRSLEEDRVLPLAHMLDARQFLKAPVSGMDDAVYYYQRGQSGQVDRLGFFVWSDATTEKGAVAFGKKWRKNMIPESKLHYSTVGLHKLPMYVGWSGGYVTVPPVKKNPTRREYTDVVTGSRRPPGTTGSRPGRLVTRVRPKPGAPLETVEVDIEDLDPSRDTIGIASETRPGYVAKAKSRAKSRKAEEREAEARKRRLAKREIRGERATFDSARKGAQELFESNAPFYHEIVERGDPVDYLDRWFDTNEVRVGKRYKALRATKRGQELEDMHRRFSGDAVISALAYILGKDPSRRWDKVDWGSIAEYNDALMESVDGAIGDRFHLPPVALGLPPESEAFLEPPEIQEQHRWMEAQEELWAAVEAMEDAYKSVRKCLSKEHRRVIRARIRDVKAWAEDPAIAPDWACVTDAVYCDYPVLWAEVDQIKFACESGYDPNWVLSQDAVSEAAPVETLPWEGGGDADDLDVPWENPKAIKLSPTVVSVIEIDVKELAADPEGYGLDREETFAYLSLADSVHGDRMAVPEDPLVREAVWRLLTNLSNAYSDAERGRGEPGVDRRFASQAARSLGTLATKVARYGAQPSSARLHVR